MSTLEEHRAVGTLVAAVADAIRDLGSVPSGQLYARVMAHMSIGTYLSIIDILKRAKLVSDTNHLLTWIGPAKS